MENVTVSDGSTLRIDMSGTLTVNDHSKFRSMIQSDECTGKNLIILNMEKIEFIDSAGMGMLLFASKAAQSATWSLRIQNPTGQVQKMIELAKLDQMLDVSYT
ncbi:anti-sigma factor antagonist [Hwanghaeella grinnelliae]|uniref:Anti-sigma factor antagonist n=1 Tax=Hwanghaeella grinnelliae TaxID=2500179 RepID=A0A3S2WA92_9PROT|nr:STAS domain-containing protein [Hwanghaeella grinnelliae]RVU37762.1 anti-sigma factor antagonist [Hwanghaeella grinnelliae]